MSQPRQKLNSARVTARINTNLEKGLVAYTIVAGAAGFVAATPSAEAKIVYTPLNISISHSAPTLIDLNNDGVADFALSFVSGEHSTWLSVFPRVAGNGIRAAHPGAAAGFFGVPVGLGEKFYSRSQGVYMARKFQYGTASGFNGPWAYATNRYLGLRFTVGGKTHFGWARLTVGNWKEGGQVVLTGYAYETIPDKSIVDGHVSGSSVGLVAATALEDHARPPASLGALARGGVGLALWRREDIGPTTG